MNRSCPNWVIVLGEEKDQGGGVGCAKKREGDSHPRGKIVPERLKKGKRKRGGLKG